MPRAVLGIAFDAPDTFSCYDNTNRSVVHFSSNLQNYIVVTKEVTQNVYHWIEIGKLVSLYINF